MIQMSGDHLVLKKLTLFLVNLILMEWVLDKTKSTNSPTPLTQKELLLPRLKLKEKPKLKLLKLNKHLQKIFQKKVSALKTLRWSWNMVNAQKLKLSAYSAKPTMIPLMLS